MNLKKILTYGALGTALLAFAPNTTTPAHASNTATTTISIHVPSIRVLCVDEQGNIITVKSNTREEQPEVFKAYRGNTEISMTDEILQQYEQLIAENDFKGGVYDIRPGLVKMIPEETKDVSELEKTVSSTLLSEKVTVNGEWQKTDSVYKDGDYTFEITTYKRIAE